MKKTYSDRFMAMTSAQRQAEVAHFDAEDVKPGKPLSPEMRKQWNRAKRRAAAGPAKPADKRVARVLVSLPPELLRQADAYAHEHGLSRAGGRGGGTAQSACAMSQGAQSQKRWDVTFGLAHLWRRRPDVGAITVSMLVPF